MNVLLIFFAIPLATIILSAIFETFIHCPIKVAGIFFSIFIVVAFALGGSAELIVTAIIYSILSLITALIVRVVVNRQCNQNNNCYYNNSMNGLLYNNTEFRRINNFNENNITGLNNGECENTILEPADAVSFNNLNTQNMCRRCR